MRLLLDTHALLWAMESNPRLSESAKTAITDPDNDVFISIASLWEIAIKLSLGKLQLPQAWLPQLQTHMAANAVSFFAISPAHCQRLVVLPMHHRDPFDRMLVAQSAEDGLTIVSADDALDSYGITRIW